MVTETGVTVTMENSNETLCKGDSGSGRGGN